MRNITGAFSHLCGLRNWRYSNTLCSKSDEWKSRLLVLKAEHRKGKVMQQSLPTRQIIRQQSYRIRNFFSLKKFECGVFWVFIKPRATWFSNGAALFHEVYSWTRYLRIETLALNFGLKNFLMSQIFPSCRTSHSPYSTTLIVSLSFISN